MLNKKIRKVLDDQIALIIQLNKNVYSAPSPALSNSSVGEHTRHIIEMFTCLLDNYEKGELNYDLRERNRMIETDPIYAIRCISDIMKNLERPDKKLIILQQLDEKETWIETSYMRELVYNFEHCIHHQALVKTALINHPEIALPENFGLAPSTILFRKKLKESHPID